jgi:hypothetical protein
MRLISSGLSVQVRRSPSSQPWHGLQSVIRFSGALLGCSLPRTPFPSMWWMRMRELLLQSLHSWLSRSSVTRRMPSRLWLLPSPKRIRCRDFCAHSVQRVCSGITDRTAQSAQMPAAFRRKARRRARSRQMSHVFLPGVAGDFRHATQSPRAAAARLSSLLLALLARRCAAQRVRPGDAGRGQNWQRPLALPSSWYRFCPEVARL